MKKTLLAALLFIASCAPAHAAVIAEMPNKSGGLIRLTDTSCDGGGLIAFATNPDGTYFAGCWTAQDNMVMVRWQGGAGRMYPIEDFDAPKGVKRARKDGAGA